MYCRYMHENQGLTFRAETVHERKYILPEIRDKMAVTYAHYLINVFSCQDFFLIQIVL